MRTGEPNETSWMEWKEQMLALSHKSGFSLPPPLGSLLGPNDPPLLTTPLLVEWWRGQMSSRRRVGLCGWAGSSKLEKNPFGTPFGEGSIEGATPEMDKRRGYQPFLSGWQGKVDMGVPARFHPGSTAWLWNPGK